MKNYLPGLMLTEAYAAESKCIAYKLSQERIALIILVGLLDKFVTGRATSGIALQAILRFSSRGIDTIHGLA